MVREVDQDMKREEKGDREITLPSLKSTSKHLVR
jgi:hypothetical protein